MLSPRELSEKDGLLIQRPIREIEAYRKDPVYYDDVYVKECTRLTGVEGRSLDLTVRVKPAGDTLYQKFTIKVAEDEEFCTSITYDPADSMLYFDRTYSGFMHYIISERKAHVRNRGGEIRLRLMIDRFSVEIFVNDGEQVMSNTIYTRRRRGGHRCGEIYDREVNDWKTRPMRPRFLFAVFGWLGTEGHLQEIILPPQGSSWSRNQENLLRMPKSYNRFRNPWGTYTRKPAPVPKITTGAEIHGVHTQEICSLCPKRHTKTAFSRNKLL